MLNLASSPRARLTRWPSARFDGSRGYPPRGYFYNCSPREPFYIKSGAWSPDDRTVYLASTGFRPWNHMSGFPLRGMCDSASAFSAGRTATFKWLNYTGCDSLYSAAADASGAYFAGHERYSQNPNGCNTQGPGAIAAPGIEALNPATGMLLVNGQGTGLYTRDRGLGAAAGHRLAVVHDVHLRGDPPASARWQALIVAFAQAAERFGHEPVHGPLFEDIGVFQRLGAGTDVVRKEMYDFRDKGDRHVALRPEATASVARAFVQHRPPTPWKVWCVTPAFRYERPQAGRLRQHHQVDVELATKVRQDVTNGGASWLADDVADEQRPHQAGAVGHRA